MKILRHRLNYQQLAAVITACFFSSFVCAGVIRGFDQPGTTHLGQTSANYFAVNTDGVGHFLLAPYFSTQSGNATILSLTNTDHFNGKALKIRVRGAENADSVLDLTVLMAPEDVWSGVLTQNALTGLTQLTSMDSTCSIPSLLNGASVNASTSRLRPSSSSAELANQTREGYIEVITMADIPLLGTIASAPGSLIQSITEASRVSRNCAAPAVLATQVNVDSEVAAASLGFATPTTGVQGSWTIVNVPLTLTYSGEVTAMEARDTATGLAARANFVFFPQGAQQVTGVDGLTADPVFRTTPMAGKSSSGDSIAYVPVTGGLPVLNAVLSDFPDFSTPYLTGLTIPAQQINELNRLLAVTSITNEYTTEATIVAATDWVLTMPTRRYSVGTDFRQSSPMLIFSASANASGVEYFSTANTTFVNDKSCTVLDDQAYFDRSSNGRHRPASDQSVASLVPLTVCGSIPVMKFAPNSAVLASVTTFSVSNAAYVNGWASINTHNTVFFKGQPVKPGVPLLGASFTRAANPAASLGVSGNYGITSTHNITR